MDILRLHESIGQSKSGPLAQGIRNLVQSVQKVPHQLPTLESCKNDLLFQRLRKI